MILKIVSLMSAITVLAFSMLFLMTISSGGFNSHLAMFYLFISLGSGFLAGIGWYGINHPNKWVRFSVFGGMFGVLVVMWLFS